MPTLNSAEKKFFDDYLNTLPHDARPRDPRISASVAGTPEITDELLALYLMGKKTAGSSVVEGINASPEVFMPAVGDYWIYLNSKNEPSALLLTTRIELRKFRDVPESIARDEGEGDLSLAYWRRVHSELWTPYLERWGLKSMDDATIITEWFRILLPKIGIANE